MSKIETTDRDDPFPGVWRISLPTPYPVGRVNVFLVEGDPPLLIDCGVRSSLAREELEAGLERHGVRLGDLGGVLLTHHHYDHAGFAAELARSKDLAVSAHGAALGLSKLGRVSFAAILRTYGAPESLLEALDMMEEAGAKLGEPLENVPGLTCLTDGASIPSGLGKLTALHTPGHDPGHLCFHVSAADLLFCGDLLLAAITPNPLPHWDAEASTGRQSSLLHYFASLDRVEALAAAAAGPVAGLPGHGDMLTDVGEAARRSREHIQKRTGKVLRLCQMHEGESLYELAGRFFGEDNPLGQALAFCELLAHGDWLEAEGKISVDPRNGVVTPR